MATNRADTLDPALLRPGRLDRKIEFPMPDRRQKRLVFQVSTCCLCNHVVGTTSPCCSSRTLWRLCLYCSVGPDSRLALTAGRAAAVQLR